jgi:hypothetical protein
MTPDPIVEEVRRHRMEHTQYFGGNLNLICQDFRRIQRESGIQVVRRSPKLLKPRSGNAMAEAFEILSHSFETGQPDLAARHDEHQP